MIFLPTERGVGCKGAIAALFEGQLEWPLGERPGNIMWRQ